MIILRRHPSGLSCPLHFVFSVVVSVVFVWGNKATRVHEPAQGDHRSSGTSPHQRLPHAANSQPFPITPRLYSPLQTCLVLDSPAGSPRRPYPAATPPSPGTPCARSGTTARKANAAKQLRTTKTKNEHYRRQPKQKSQQQKTRYFIPQEFNLLPLTCFFL